MVDREQALGQALTFIRQDMVEWLLGVSLHRRCPLGIALTLLVPSVHHTCTSAAWSKCGRSAPQNMTGVHASSANAGCSGTWEIWHWHSSSAHLCSPNFLWVKTVPTEKATLVRSVLNSRAFLSWASRREYSVCSSCTASKTSVKRFLYICFFLQAMSTCEPSWPQYPS